MKYFNSHAPCGARHENFMQFYDYLIISTHTPHAGRDENFMQFYDYLIDFNSHAPCGARQAIMLPICRMASFQLTRPMRGATRGPHPLRFWVYAISTHTPHAGRDAGTHAPGAQVVRFQLTRPMRGATSAYERLREF